MGTWRYCVQEAGAFRQFHKMCKAAFAREEHNRKDVVNQAIVLSTRYARGDLERQSFVSELRKHTKEAKISRDEMHEILLCAWEKTLDHFLEDNIISEAEESWLVEVARQFQLMQEELEARGAIVRTAMGATIRDVLAGKRPTKLNVY